MMPWEAWLTVAVVAMMIVALARNVAGPDIIIVGALTLLMTVGALSGSELLPSPAIAVRGFGNEGLITVAALFIVTAGLIKTGAMSLAVLPIIGRPKSIPGAQTRLMLPVAGLSAFLNNTPVVAMFLPVVSDWCRKHSLSPAKLFMPLSYAAIAGGTCTLIGTSTNLVVYGMLEDFGEAGKAAHARIGLFTIAAVGVPVTALVIAYVIMATQRLLPDRKTPRAEIADPRRYTVEMHVEPGSAVDGKSIEQAGLRNLPGAYLMEIERNGDRLVAVGPEQMLKGGDRLIFVGIVESVVDLQKIRGLTPATDQVFKLTDPRPNRMLVEAVVSDSCPLVGRSIRSGRFRTRYDAVVIAVHRNGHLLTNTKVGDIVLRAGDTLLIETHPRFVEQQRDSRDFFLVSAVEGSQPVRHDRAWVALLILAGMVAAAALNVVTILNAAFLAAGLMVLTRCCTGGEARSSVEWRVLLVIGAALGIGEAMRLSTAAETIATTLIGVTQGHPWLVLLMVYVTTAAFTELITNNAAAVLVVPIAIAAAESLGVNVVPFVIVVMVAASASFATPIGYQTNLMVYGPGGYRFSDYLRFGLPLNLLVMIVAVTLAPMVWSFEQ